MQKITKFFSINFLIKCFIFLWDISVILFCYKIFSYDWHDDFFNILQQKDIQHYQLVQFITTAPSEYTDNSGRQEPPLKWTQSMQSFLQVMNKYKQKKKSPQFTIALIFDDKTYDRYQQQLNEWKQNFPDLIISMKMQELVELYQGRMPLLKECDAFDSDFCKNLLKFNYLSNEKLEKKFTVFLNPELFSILHPGLYTNYFSVIRHPVTSTNALGFFKENTLSVGWLAFDHLQVYDGFITDSASVSLWKIFKARTQLLIEEYQEPLTHLLERKQLIHQDYAHYKKYLLKRAQWWKDHPFMNFNQASFLSHIAGSHYWIDLNLNGYTNYVLIPEWLSGYLSYKKIPFEMNYHDAAITFGEVGAEAVILMTLLEYDIAYWTKHDIRWTNELIDYQKQLLNSLEEGQRLLFYKFNE